MSVPPLAGLEGQGRGSLGGGGSPVWVSCTFSAGSSTVQGTHPHGFIFPDFHQGDRFGGTDSLSCRERGGRTSSSSFSGLLQPDVRHLEDLRVVEARDRPHGLQSLRFQYLGTVINTQNFRTSPSRERIDKLMSLRDVFLSSRLQPVSIWLTLLGTLSSLSHLVRGIASICELFSLLSIARGIAWTIPSWSPGRTTVYRIFFGGWTPTVFLRGCLGLLHFYSFVNHSTVEVFADNSPAMAYLRNARGTRSPASFPLPSVSSDGQNSTMSPWLPSSSWEVTMFCLPLSLSPGPDPRVRVDSPHGDLSGVPLTMAGNDRPLCYLSKSPLLHLFLALPRSSGDGDGLSPTVQGPSPGLRVPSLGYDSTSPPQAPIVIQSCADSDRPVLTSDALVYGCAGTSNCPTGNVASSSSSPQPASLLSSSSQSPQALSSCLTTLQRFARAAGFSSRVAAQVALAWRSSSRTNYHLKWSVYRQWCSSVGHYISNVPALALQADVLLY